MPAARSHAPADHFSPDRVRLTDLNGSPERMFVSRLAEVAWGVCVAVATVWLAGRLPAAHLNSQPRP